jgi:alpha-beta hydrolase superfamily lysophospholipase
MVLALIKAYFIYMWKKLQKEKQIMGLITLVGAYFIVMGLLFILSNVIIFQPPARRDREPLPHSIQIPLGQDGHISAMYIPNPQAHFTLLMSHGNAEDLRVLQPLMEGFVAAGYAVLAYDYRGYGNSTGRPSEKNTYEDIAAAYHYLTHTLLISPDHIILFGFSLGTGPTIDLATKVPVAGVILQSPFLSAFRVVTMLPIFPMDKFRNLQKVSHLHAPVLVIQATRDSIIPPWHTARIYKAITSPKQWYAVEGADHNNLAQVAGEQYWAHINAFTQTLRHPVVRANS